jgi:hypothetical protein
MFGLFQLKNCQTKLYRISNVWSLPVTKTVKQISTGYQMFGLFQSTKLSHKAVQNIKCLVTSIHQNCETNLYRISNVCSHPVTKIITKRCTQYQIFVLFQSPKLSKKAVQNIKYLVSSSQQNCQRKLYRISNVWSPLVTKTVTQCCTVYQMFGLF